MLVHANIYQTERQPTMSIDMIRSLTNTRKRASQDLSEQASPSSAIELNEQELALVTGARGGGHGGGNHGGGNHHGGGYRGGNHYGGNHHRGGYRGGGYHRHNRHWRNG